MTLRVCACGHAYISHDDEGQDTLTGCRVCDCIISHQELVS